MYRIQNKSLAAPLTLTLALGIIFAPTLNSQAFASEIQTSNTGTGANSTNSNTVDYTNNVSVSSSTTGSTNTNVSFSATTGGGTVANNTSVGDIQTGDVVFDLAATNNINNGTSVSIPSGSSFNVTGSNSLTGSGSTNSNLFSINNDINLSQTQNATANNDINLDLNTGGLRVRNNTLVGDITTGSILVRIRINNNLNNGGPGSGGGNTPPIDGFGGGVITDIPTLISAATSTNPKTKIEFFPTGTSPFTSFYIFLVIASLGALIHSQRQRISFASIGPLLARFSTSNGRPAYEHRRTLRKQTNKIFARRHGKKK